jgi:hypothetical protein
VALGVLFLAAATVASVTANRRGEK